MNDTTDRTPTEDQQDTRQDADRTDATRQDATVGVVEAARLMGVTPDAVRSRLRRGTLQGHKDGDEWRVVMPADRMPTVGQQDATGERQDTDATGDSRRQDGPTERDTTPTVDLAPLADLIDDLTRRNADLAASSAFWQLRAMQAEEQLKAITAGNDVVAEDPAPEPVSEAIASPQSDAPEPTGIVAWWRRLWSG